MLTVGEALVDTVGQGFLARVSVDTCVHKDLAQRYQLGPRLLSTSWPSPCRSSPISAFEVIAVNTYIGGAATQQPHPRLRPVPALRPSPF